MEIGFRCLDPYPIGDAEQYAPLFKYATEYELIDRLYRRYVRYEDLEATKKLVEQIFDEISFDVVARRDFIKAYDWCLEDVEECSGENGEMYGKGGNYCRPIRIINIHGSNAIFYVGMEKYLPFGEYDELEGAPFWADPAYLSERLDVINVRKMLANGETIAEIAEQFRCSEAEVLDWKRKGERKPPRE